VWRVNPFVLMETVSIGGPGSTTVVTGIPWCT
jgi:hypothetical protein